MMGRSLSPQCSQGRGPENLICDVGPRAGRSSFLHKENDMHTSTVITRAPALAAAFALVFTFALAADGLAQPPTSAAAAGAGKAKRGRYAEVNGLKLYYEVRGSGKPLVLLHGGLGSTDMFAPLLPTLSKGRQIIAVDLQGHGRTADIDRPLDASLMADDIAELCKQLKIARADIMGYSLGGAVALQTVIRHPQLVNKLVVVSAGFRRNAIYPELLAQQGQFGAAAAEALKQTPMYQLYSAVAPRPQDFPRLLDKIGEAMKKDFDWSKQIAEIKSPMLIVAGDSDMFPPSHAVEMFGLLGGGKKDPGWDGAGRVASRLAILPGLTHYNIFAEPTLAATAVRFLDEPTPRG
jgi:pimeloyl-ACP methyl ester carboxylesterase